MSCINFSVNVRERSPPVTARSKGHSPVHPVCFHPGKAVLVDPEHQLQAPGHALHILGTLGKGKGREKRHLEISQWRIPSLHWASLLRAFPPQNRGAALGLLQNGASCRLSSLLLMSEALFPIHLNLPSWYNASCHRHGDGEQGNYFSGTDR